MKHLLNIIRTDYEKYVALMDRGVRIKSGLNYSQHNIFNEFWTFRSFENRFKVLSSDDLFPCFVLKPRHYSTLYFNFGSGLEIPTEYDILGVLNLSNELVRQAVSSRITSHVKNIVDLVSNNGLYDFQLKDLNNSFDVRNLNIYRKDQVTRLDD